MIHTTCTLYNVSTIAKQQDVDFFYSKNAFVLSARKQTIVYYIHDEKNYSIPSLVFNKLIEGV